MRFKKHIESSFTTVHNTFLKDKKLSLKARGMLITMLSLPDTWNFSIKGLMSILPDGQKRVSSALKELENNKYLIRERVYENGKVIDWQYIISDEPLLDVRNVNVDEEYVDILHVQSPDDYKYTNKSNTNKLNTNQSINLAERIDMMDMIKNNISYDIICTDDIKGMLDELVEIITDCCLLSAPIKIAGQEMFPEVVKAQMLKLNSEHIVYVMGCMEQNKSKINNIRSYIITALYNAVSTMGLYYRAEVNYDLS